MVPEFGSRIHIMLHNKHSAARSSIVIPKYLARRILRFPRRLSCRLMQRCGKSVADWWLHSKSVLSNARGVGVCWLWFADRA